MRRPFISTSLRVMTMPSGSVEYNELNQCMSPAIVGTLPRAAVTKEFVECYLLSVEFHRRPCLSAKCTCNMRFNEETKNKQRHYSSNYFLIHTSNHNVHAIFVAHTESG